MPGRNLSNLWLQLLIQVVFYLHGQPSPLSPLVLSRFVLGELFEVSHACTKSVGFMKIVQSNCLVVHLLENHRPTGEPLPGLFKLFPHRTYPLLTLLFLLWGLRVFHSTHFSFVFSSFSLPASLQLSPKFTCGT